MQLLYVVFGLSHARTQLSAAMHFGDVLPAGNATRTRVRAADATPPPKQLEVEQGFLARARLEPHGTMEGSGIEDLKGPPTGAGPKTRAETRTPRISQLTNGRASRGSQRSAPSFPFAREAMAALALVSGLIAIGLSWVRPQKEVEIADEPFAGMLCAIQAAAALAALGVLAHAMYAPPAPGLRGVLILADGLAHGALLLRGVLSVVEAKHTVAAQQYRRRLVAWSAWLDVRSQLSSVIAVVSWSTASIVLVLFVMVTIGGKTLFPWAWWANHAVLSVACLALACAQQERHPSQPPIAMLLANVVAGMAHAAPAAGAPVPDLGILGCALLQLAEAFRASRLARLDGDGRGTKAATFHGAARAHGGQIWLSALDRQLHATLVGNEDTGEFEQYLGRERRVCVFYAFQDLLGCESAASHSEMQEKFAAWRSLFSANRAPLRVEGLPPVSHGAKCDVCPQASVHKTKQALIGILRDPYARYLSEKRRTLSASSGFQRDTKSREQPSLLTAMRVPACLAKANANDGPSTIV